jgi:hypothetical protein
LVPFSTRIGNPREAASLQSPGAGALACEWPGGASWDPARNDPELETRPSPDGSALAPPCECTGCAFCALCGEEPALDCGACALSGDEPSLGCRCCGPPGECTGDAFGDPPREAPSIGPLPSSEASAFATWQRGAISPPSPLVRKERARCGGIQTTTEPGAPTPLALGFPFKGSVLGFVGE